MLFSNHYKVVSSGLSYTKVLNLEALTEIKLLYFDYRFSGIW
jgi:hypothetical protein